jgi:hypothetical protein
MIRTLQAYKPFNLMHLRNLELDGNSDLQFMEAWIWIKSSGSGTGLTQPREDN